MPLADAGAYLTRDEIHHLRRKSSVRGAWLHLEHHLFLFVPCWRLPETHRVLVGKGLAPRMEIQPGYRAMLRRATNAGQDAHSGPRMDTQQHI